MRTSWTAIRERLGWHRNGFGGAGDRPLELLATIWPAWPHFRDFARDPRLSAIRVNPPMATPEELERELHAHIGPLHLWDSPVGLLYDVKGRQLRIERSEEVGDHLECVLNHPIALDCSDSAARVVLFKAGGDRGIIDRVAEDGRRLVFRNGAQFGPRWRVKMGESIHIRHPSVRVIGSIFTDTERQKIAIARAIGFRKFFLSYVESQRDEDELRELVGRDAEVWLKIESPAGLEFVARKFVKRERVILVAACGDLFIELPRSCDVLPALRLIIERDSEACVGSRILLSVVQRPMPPKEKEYLLERVYASVPARDADAVALRDFLAAVFHDPMPSLADFAQLAWLYDIGYRRMMLCDELCTAGKPLATALDAFEEFRPSYATRRRKATAA